MASNRHGSARVALLFCLLLAIGELLHACRPPLLPEFKVVDVQNGVNGEWESMSVDDGIAEREPPASRTPIDGLAKGAIQTGRLLLMNMPVNAPVPPTQGNHPQPGCPC